MKGRGTVGHKNTLVALKLIAQTFLSLHIAFACKGDIFQSECFHKSSSWFLFPGSSSLTTWDWNVLHLAESVYIHQQQHAAHALSLHNYSIIKPGSESATALLWSEELHYTFAKLTSFPSTSFPLVKPENTVWAQKISALWSCKHTMMESVSFR